MAERRMFAKSIIDSDAFLDMPLSTQCLYFHLNMRADDDGFINNPKKIQRMIGCSDDDLKLLIAKNFIIPFESGVVVIKHWRINNYLRSDRYKETNYLEEKSQLDVKENGSYTLGIPSGVPSGIPMVTDRETQYRIGKDRLGKDSIEREDSQARPTRHKYGPFSNVLLSDDEMEKLKEKFPNDYEMRINDLSIYIDSKGAKYKSHYSTILNWDRMDQKRKSERQQKPQENASFETDEFLGLALSRS